MNNEEKLKEAFEKYKSFESEFDRTKKYTESYAQRMQKIMEEEKAIYYCDGKWKASFIRNRDHFAEITGLGLATYDRIKYNVPGWVPSIKTFMTLAMIYRLNITIVRELRNSYGYDFNPQKRTDQAYVYLLVNCMGKSISYCNKVLEVLGIDKKYYLGDGTIDEGAVVAEVLNDDV